MLLFITVVLGILFRVVKFLIPIISPQSLGVYSVGGTPVPIPNTEVKLHCVDGTSWLHVGE